MSYYYNPNPTEKAVHEPSLFPIQFNQSEFYSNAHTNKKLHRKIREAHEMSVAANDTIKEASLMAVYLAYGSVCSGFVSYASQKQLAKISKLHTDTVRRGVKWLRKVGVIKTFHRYSGEGVERRRTTSKTVLVMFVEFCVWLKNKIVRAENTKNIIGCGVDKKTGEIINFLPNAVRESAVVNYLCTKYQKLGVFGKSQSNSHGFNDYLAFAVS